MPNDPPHGISRRDLDDVRDAAEGDPNGELGPLIERHDEGMRYLVRRCIPRELRIDLDTDDVVQEVYLRAWKRFPELACLPVHDVAACLKCMAVDIINMARRRFLAGRCDGRRNVALDTACLRHDARFLDGVQNPPDEDAGRRELLALLERAVKRLQPASAEIIRLRHEDGLKFPEIAVRVGRTEDAVRHQYDRCIAIIRKRLEHCVRGGGSLQTNVDASRSPFNSGFAKAAHVSPTEPSPNSSNPHINQ